MLDEKPTPTPVEVVMERPFRHEEGFLWLIYVSVQGDSTDVGDNFSDMVVYEDGKPLGPAQATHGDIRHEGSGRYSHWMDQLYFSTSDNSDPNTNGREYKYVVTPRDTMRDLASYGLRMARAYREPYANPSGKRMFEGLSVFELGPGSSLATAMAIAAYGGQAFVREREPLAWDVKRHGEIAKRMLDLLQEVGDPYDPAPLLHAIETGKPSDDVIYIMNEEVSEVCAKLKGKIDFTCSTAVLEHVYDAREELQFLYDISRSGADGYHAVDFRDHHYPERPLTFFLEGDVSYIESSQYLYSRGSRIRYPAFRGIAEEIGFTLREHKTEYADESYLDSFMKQLANSGSRFMGLTRKDVACLTAFLLFHKP